jgi:hypothetical protein
MDSVFIRDTPYFVANKVIVFSGNVLSNELPVARAIHIHKNRGINAQYFGTSDGATGDWSIEVSGNANDRFRVIIIGNPGEFSKIFEDVQGV